MKQKCFEFETKRDYLLKVLEDYKLRLKNPVFNAMFKNAIKIRIKELERELEKLEENND